MELLRDVGLVESHFGPFGECVSVGARYMHGLRHTYRWLRNYFGRSRWYSYVMRLRLKLISVCLEIVQILMQDRCTVCPEHTKGSEIILDAPNGTLR